MRTALISDVHGNLPALQAVLADVDAVKPDRIVCLGDTVGYGPQPRECLELVRRRCSIVLAGNHENAVVNGADNFTPLAAKALDWTASRLRDPEIMEYLAGLKSITREGDLAFLHGSLKDPVNEYVREAESPWMFYQLVNTLRRDFVDVRLCFVGHNHRAFLGTELGYIFPHDKTEPKRMTFNLQGQKAYVSVGSVGQPRDRDPRASWALFDGEAITYHRVAYDARPVAEMIRQKGLPEFLAARLLQGE